MDKSAVFCGILSGGLSALAAFSAVMQIWPVAIGVGGTWLLFMGILGVRVLLNG